MRPALLPSVAALCLAGPACSATAPADPRLAPELAAALATSPPSSRLPVIVVLDGDFENAAGAVSLRALRDAHRRRVAALLDDLGGGLPARATDLWIIDGAALTATRDEVLALAARPGVREVRLDRSWRRPPSPPPSDDGSDAAWNLAAIRAPEAWAAGHRGAGVVVANLDTGVDLAHPDLAASWRGGGNSWLDAWGEHPAPVDLDGHGTRTMGLIVGGAASGAPIGVAPGARWIAARIYDDRGVTSTSAVHRALQWLADPDGDPDTDDAPDVVSHSWGFEGRAGDCVAEFAPDLALLSAHGVAMAFAAGNGGPGRATSTSPANYQTSLSVGAIDGELEVEPASSRGPSACGGGIFPSLVAPGVEVRTTDLSLGGRPGAYATVSGTSFAAPHVAGAMALLRGARPSATPVEIERALRRSAAPLGPTGDDNDVGAGLVDVMGALRALQERPPSVDGGSTSGSDGGTSRDGAGGGCRVGGGTRTGDGALVALALLLAARRRGP